MAEEGQEGMFATESESLMALQGLEVSEEFSQKAPEIERAVFGIESDQNNDDSQQAETNEASDELDNQNQDGETSTDTNEQDTDDDDLSIEHEMFGGKHKVVNTPVNEHGEIENIEVIDSYLKKSGFDFSAKELAERVTTWKQAEETLQQKSKQLEDVEKLFSIMPQELYKAVDLVAKGKDWREALSAPSKIDYSKDVSELNLQDVVEAYFPGKITSEMWEEYKDEDGDPRIKAAVDVVLDQAKQAFNGDKSKKQELAEKEIGTQKEFIEKYNSSIRNTISKLPEKIEGISESYVKKVEKELQSNDSIRNLFFDENGIMKEDAAMAYVMAKDGIALLDKYKQVLQKRIETEKNLEILQRGARTPRATSGQGGASGSGQEISPEVQKQLEWIRSMGK